MFRGSTGWSSEYIKICTCLKWINGCPWDEDICSIAAEKGNLNVLKYAHENNCPWDSNTCAQAAMDGHLEVLKYLHENKCPWD